MILLTNLGGRSVNGRMRRHVLDNEFRVCIDCGYSLRNLAEEHRCPECGVQYDASELERAWRAWFSLDPASAEA